LVNVTPGYQTPRARFRRAAPAAPPRQAQRDGSFVTFLQDVTEKTDYEEINGTVNDIRMLARPAAPVRTIAAGKDLKALPLRWFG
jgi:hypothetical protein